MGTEYEVAKIHSKISSSYTFLLNKPIYYYFEYWSTLYASQKCYFQCNGFSPPPALEINNNIDIPEVIICKDEKFSPIKKRKIDFDLNGITRHAIFETPKDTRKPAKNKKLSASDQFYEAIYEGPTLSCTSCNKLYYSTTIKTYDIQDSWRSILSTLISPQNTAGLFCDRCIKCLKQKKMPTLCVLNNLQVMKIPDVQHC